MVLKAKGVWSAVEAVMGVVSGEFQCYSQGLSCLVEDRSLSRSSCRAGANLKLDPGEFLF